MMFRSLIAAAGLIAAFAMVTVDADARPKLSAGSRGTRTQSAPPATNTAPTTAAPIQRTQTPPAAQQPAAAARPAAAPNVGAAPAKTGFFNRPGFMGGLVAGMLGAGLIGALFGQGLFGNMAGMASFLGLLLQIALIGGIAFFAIRWWRNRQQPQPAFAGAPAGGPSEARSQFAMGAQPMGAPQSMDAQPMGAPQPMQNQAYGNGAASNGYAPQQQPGEPTDEIGIKGDDYETFERLLTDMQSAYSREDRNALRNIVTDEMVGYLTQEIDDNVSRGVAAQLSGVKLLQGDLAEAWNEGPVDYATVAMRYEIVDALVDRNTKRVVDGDATKPVEAVEVWTFTRPKGTMNWKVAAIQQLEDEQAA
ncbi:Tim44-like domain protein [Variibacter gotjawalensis]|uniref:Tim44-like domain protein n=1 Tax=Variibacter gotjawalensis TaxID=1333996 RepID=A0A0S3PV49_9BRAD|nr:Tim44 domain-containing protein [Variibacter gotjawalensis]NIK50058.1 putative lipid-binding transport protein (Tim44 family) [Variibacter gotjawalensis]RZS46057.1 putative lipid-binding transport protein (Tim44 family) [Variibacter gotjawalensis]BAT59732.1 Tim44-like domain protein [Variibacter gotjawalensis]